MDFLEIAKSAGLLFVIAAIFGVLIVYFSIKFYVKLDNRVSDIKGHLSGINCGACGYPGCAAFASAIVEGKAKVTGCPSMSKDNREKITEVLASHNKD